jgi:hypothetical protein
VKKLLIVFCLLPLGTLLWPSLGRAWECDPAISRGTCGGSGQKYPATGRSAVPDLVSPKRMLVNEPIRRAAGRVESSRNAMQLARADAGMPEPYSPNSPVQTLKSRVQPGVDVRNFADKVSSASSSMNPGSQPGSGALLIAGFLAMFAVARRRISSILG